MAIEIKGAEAGQIKISLKSRGVDEENWPKICKTIAARTDILSGSVRTDKEGWLYATVNDDRLTGPKLVNFYNTVHSKVEQTIEHKVRMQKKAKMKAQAKV
jgi:hypothetical protein